MNTPTKPAILPFISSKPPPIFSNAGLNCEGSGQRPVIKNGKPCCQVCGQAFRWQDLINRAQECPEHG